MQPVQILPILDWGAKIAFATAIISLPFFLVNWIIYIGRIRKNRSLLPDYLKAPFPKKSVAAFSISILLAMLIASTSQTIARSSINESLSGINESFQFKIDGVQVQQKDKIISALKSLSWMPAHHSHPTNRILVEAASKSTHLKLVLGRDSSNPEEYWVFVPDYYITSKNEIGRIVSSAFNAY